MLGVSMTVASGVSDVYWVHQTSWTGCPCSSLHCQYSSLHCQRTRIWPGWSDGLERNCLWAVSSLFSPDGLERRSHHDIWLQVSSVPSVDSAIGGLDHVGVSTFECFSHGASCPLALFVVEELDLFPNLEGMQISGSMGSVELFFLFFLELD